MLPDYHAALSLLLYGPIKKYTVAEGPLRPCFEVGYGFPKPGGPSVLWSMKFAVHSIWFTKVEVYIKIEILSRSDS